MKSLFLYAYPEVYQNNQYIFNNTKIFEELINSIIFVPYKIDGAYASTLKDYLVIFINGLPPRDYTKIQILNSFIAHIHSKIMIFLEMYAMNIFL